MAKATSKQRTIRATRIEVTDERGRVRLVLGFLGRSENGVYGMAVRDAHGRDRAWVMHDGPTAQVGLDYEGAMVAGLTVSQEGVAELVIEDGSVELPY